MQEDVESTAPSQVRSHRDGAESVISMDPPNSVVSNDEESQMGGSPENFPQGISRNLNINFFANHRSDVLSNVAFRSFYGINEELLLTEILLFLNAKELCAVGTVSKSFRRAASLPLLWSELIKIDFDPELSDSEDLSQFTRNIGHILSYQSSKSLYIRKYHEMRQRVNRCKESYVQQEVQRRREERVAICQRFLDITQVRVLIPLPFFAFFGFLVLLALQYDGYGLPAWSPFIPIFIFALFLLFSIAITCIIFRRRYRSASILFDLWNTLRGPIRFIYVETLGENRVAAKAIFVTVMLFILQTIFLVIKLAGYDDDASRTASDISHKLSWGWVFVPSWCTFQLALFSPCLGCARAGVGAYIFFIILIWIPVFVLFVCLAVKLDREEFHPNSGGKLRLSLILIPFWIVEGSILAGTLAALVSTAIWRQD